MTEMFDFQYKRAFQVSVEWKTIVDDVYSGGEQRRNLWTQPRRKWVLEFSKNSTDTNAIMDFFNARRGRYEAFNWVWQDVHPVTGENMGGDGAVYTVRFDQDELNFEHLAMGYNKFQITLVEVNN
jgi:phage-related protein